jgi:hypothetical protein
MLSCEMNLPKEIKECIFFFRGEGSCLGSLGADGSPLNIIDSDDNFRTAEPNGRLIMISA